MRKRKVKAQSKQNRGNSTSVFPLRPWPVAESCQFTRSIRSGRENSALERGLNTFEFSETFRTPVVYSCGELPCFSKLRWIARLQIPHGIR